MSWTLIVGGSYSVGLTRLVCPESEPLRSPGNILESVRRLGSRPRLMFCRSGMGACVDSFTVLLSKARALLWVSGEP